MTSTAHKKHVLAMLSVLVLLCQVAEAHTCSSWGGRISAVHDTGHVSIDSQGRIQFPQPMSSPASVCFHATPIPFMTGIPGILLYLMHVLLPRLS